MVGWIFIGLIAGGLAKFIMPGKDPGGFIVTTLLGIAGAVLGGFVGTLLNVGSFNGFDLKSMALAVGGAIILLAIYRLIFGRSGGKKTGGKKSSSRD